MSNLAIMQRLGVVVCAVLFSSLDPVCHPEKSSHFAGRKSNDRLCLSVLCGLCVENRDNGWLNAETAEKEDETNVPLIEPRTTNHERRPPSFSNRFRYQVEFVPHLSRFVPLLSHWVLGQITICICNSYSIFQARFRDFLKKEFNAKIRHCLTDPRIVLILVGKSGKQAEGGRR